MEDHPEVKRIHAELCSAYEQSLKRALTGEERKRVLAEAVHRFGVESRQGPRAPAPPRGPPSNVGPPAAPRAPPMTDERDELPALLPPGHPARAPAFGSDVLLPVALEVDPPVVLPEGKFVVRMHGPQGKSGKDVVGLYRRARQGMRFDALRNGRLHRGEVERHVVLKSLALRGRPRKDHVRFLKFFAPNGAGQFELRLFDGDPSEAIAEWAAEDGEQAVDPIQVHVDMIRGWSGPLRIEVQGAAIGGPLGRFLELFPERVEDLCSKAGEGLEIRKWGGRVVQLLQEVWGVLIRLRVVPSDGDWGVTLGKVLEMAVDAADRIRAQFRKEDELDCRDMLDELEIPESDRSSQADLRTAVAESRGVPNNWDLRQGVGAAFGSVGASSPLSTHQRAELNSLIQGLVKATLDEALSRPYCADAIPEETRNKLDKASERWNPVDSSFIEPHVPFWEDVRGSVSAHCSLAETVKPRRAEDSVLGAGASSEVPLVRETVTDPGPDEGWRAALAWWESVGDLPGPSEIPAEWLHRADAIVEAALPELSPSEDFGRVRADLRQRVEEAVRGLKCVTATGGRVGVVVFGSSANGLGTQASDVDLALHVEGGAPVAGSVLVEEAAAALASSGMEDVVCVATARVPIVTFRDPLSGLPVDLCASNALALRNTALLRGYAQCDIRVRLLSLFLKRWAGARRINTPREGTLSSYGITLLLLHHLQRRPVPLLPCLQALPPGLPGLVPFIVRAHDTPGGVAWRHSHVIPRPQGTALRAALPSWPESNPEQIPCETYTWSPPNNDYSPLVAACAANRESPAQLLLSMAHFHAFRFAAHRHVITIRNALLPADPPTGFTTPSSSSSPTTTTVPGFEPGRFRSDPFAGEIDRAGRLRRGWKHTEDSWSFRSAIAIEDPFEHSYDVAHVLKPQTNVALRAEFARLYVTLLYLASRPPTPENTPQKLADSLLHHAARAPFETTTIRIRKSSSPDPSPAPAPAHPPQDPKQSPPPTKSSTKAEKPPKQDPTTFFMPQQVARRK